MKLGFLSSIISWTVLIFIILLGAYIGLTLASQYDMTPGRQEFYKVFIEQIQFIAHEIWYLLRPFLQLVLVLGVVDWILNRIGINISSPRGLEWNVQTVIAITVTGAFCIAALANIGGASELKDLALVVVGFYFGTQKTSVEVKKDGSYSLTEEHVNPVEKTEKPKDDVLKGEKPK